MTDQTSRQKPAMKTCDAVLWEDGGYECTQRAGHRGEHYDDEGHWWPTQEQLATW